MTLTVVTQRRNILISSTERATVIKHHIPKRNRYFKEELRQYVEEIQLWLTGEKVDEIIFYFQHDMEWHHRALYQAILRATFRKDKLVLITGYDEEVLACGSTD